MAMKRILVEAKVSFIIEIDEKEIIETAMSEIMENIADADLLSKSGVLIDADVENYKAWDGHKQVANV